MNINFLESHWSVRTNNSTSSFAIMLGEEMILMSEVNFDLALASLIRILMVLKLG